MYRNKNINKNQDWIFFYSINNSQSLEQYLYKKFKDFNLIHPLLCAIKRKILDVVENFDIVAIELNMHNQNLAPAYDYRFLANINQ